MDEKDKVETSTGGEAAPSPVLLGDGSPSIVPHQLERRMTERLPLDIMDKEGVRRLQRNLSSYSGVPTEGPRSDDSALDKEHDLELGSIDFDHFDIRAYLTAITERSQAKGRPRRTMGLAFSQLTVKGLGSGIDQGRTVGSIFSAVPTAIKAKFAGAHKAVVKNVLEDVTGFVKPGEMLLVLGVPGSGCTSFLRTMSCYTDGFEAVEGDISHAGFDSKAVRSFLRGDVLYCGEDDVHFPTLTVEQTLEFAIATRAPPKAIRSTISPIDSRAHYIKTFQQALGTVLGLRRVFDTKVGDELIRGISGGQKKRVSIAEVIASHGKIVSFDNSTRGLDASTALDFVRALRIGTDIHRLSTMATLYQAGDNIVNMFDHVTVLYLGRQVYFGTIDGALRYFHDLGFERRSGQSVGDFLVSVTDPSSRAIRKGFESSAPITADSMARIWRESPEGQATAQATQEYLRELKLEKDRSGDAFRKGTMAEKYKHIGRNSRFSISFARQVKLALTRRFRMLKGNPSTFLIVIGSSTFQALITGSVYSGMANNTSSFFSRSGVLFFALLLNSLQALTEVAIGYMQRPIVIRQAKFGMIRPSADVLANAILTLPVRLVQMTPFSLILYFMTGLSRTADAFFIFFGTLVLASFCMISFFRMLTGLIGDVSKATMLAGLATLDVVLYTGYMIPRPSMVVWWRWLSYCNPLAFAFEMLLTNEFRKLVDVPCAQLIPAGPAYATASTANKACTVAGSPPGSTSVNGSTYLAVGYQYYFSNSARNAGIIIGFWIFFTLVHAFAADHQKDPLEGGGRVIFKRGAQPLAVDVDDPKAEEVEFPGSSQPDEKHPKADLAPKSGDTFAWEDLVYDVPVLGGTRRLLNKVSGYVKPGTLTALMGESGAGKTTLLNVLAKRTDVGVVTGSLMVNGGPLPASFQADTGYCQQQDTHLATSTVREALEFSALLRQPEHVPKPEKLAYVEEVIKMLQMESFQDALVGQVGEGLSVEQRKRLTIGVELAARPKLLICLDEPTSGLSGSASWSIVQLLRKLANSGQAILCTIHQPSGELINQFDRLLLLRRGGETVFFGDLGKDSSQLIDYFYKQSGKLCTSDMNPAEYMLDVIAGDTTSAQDWHEAFLHSELQQTLLKDLEQIKASAGAEAAARQGGGKPAQFAASFGVQAVELLKRTGGHYYRSPNYVMAKLGLNIFAGLFVGSTFWGQGAKITTAALQNKIFATFMALILSTPLAQQTQGFFLQIRDLFDSREKPSKAYNWTAMLAAFILIEVPWNFLGTTLFWLSWYYMVQFGDASDLAAFSWGALMIFSLYWATFATAIATIANNAGTASIMFSALFSFVLLFCGVTQPPPQMPYFWRSWMPPLSPFTYFVEMLMGNTLNGQIVRCSPDEFSTIIPPAGQSCWEYLQYFSSNLTSPAVPGAGYFVTQPDGTCGFCPFREGNDFWLHFDTSTYTYSSSHRYRDIGIVVAFIGFNVCLIFALFWLFRMRKDSGRPPLPRRLLAHARARLAKE